MGPYSLLAVHPKVPFLPTTFIRQCRVRMCLDAGPELSGAQSPSAAQDDLGAQREIFHQHAAVVQHLPLALAAHLPPCAEARHSTAGIGVRCCHPWEAQVYPSTPIYGQAETLRIQQKLYQHKTPKTRAYLVSVHLTQLYILLN